MRLRFLGGLESSKAGLFRSVALGDMVPRLNWLLNYDGRRVRAGEVESYSERRNAIV